MKSWLICKAPGAGKDWRWEEKGMTEDEMVGWYQWLYEHEFESVPGVGDGQGGLACCSPWSHKKSDTTEQLNWTESNHSLFCTLFPPPLIPLLFLLFLNLGSSRYICSSRHSSKPAPLRSLPRSLPAYSSEFHIPSSVFSQVSVIICTIILHFSLSTGMWTLLSSSQGYFSRMVLFSFCIYMTEHGTLNLTHTS